MTAPGAPDEHALDPDLAGRIVAEAARRYFAGCRARVPGFVARTFSLGGSLRLHRHALGWDMLRAPANALMVLPQIGLKLTAAGARRLGARRAAARIGGRSLFIDTAVARELRWRLVTELLQQPLHAGDRVSTRDALAEEILADPRVAALLAEAAARVAAHKDDPAFRLRLDTALGEYAGTRTAAAEITTALIALGTGALAFQQATPGAFALGPAIAAALAQQSAIASFPLGQTLGGLWYGVFPAQSSALLVASSTAGLMAVAAVAAAFAGILADPVQNALGLHERRLNALIDTLERGFVDSGSAGYDPYDLYVSRLIDLCDILVSITRGLRP